MDSHKQEQALDLIRLNPGRPKRDYLKCNHRMTKRLIHFISNFIKIVQKVLSPSAWSAYREHMLLVQRSHPTKAWHQVYTLMNQMNDLHKGEQCVQGTKAHSLSETCDLT